MSARISPGDRGVFALGLTLAMPERVGTAVTLHTRREDYVQLGKSLNALSVTSLPEPQRALVKSDPVLRSLVHDEVIRGDDFGKMFDRLAELDAASRSVGVGKSSGLSKADAMYVAAKGASPDAASTTGSAAPGRTRMGIFGAPVLASPKVVPASTTSAKADLDAKLDKAVDEASKLEKQGKLAEAAAKWKEAGDLELAGAGGGSAADRKSTAASHHAHAGDLYKQHAEALEAKGDTAKAKEAYQKAGDEYAIATKNMGLRPNLATLDHWDANKVADWGTTGIECYQKSGLSIQKNGDKSTIGNIDVSRVEEGVNDSYGFDRGKDRGDRMMRLGDAYARSGDKAGALRMYQAAKANYEDAIAEDKKFYPEGLQKHVFPAEKAALRAATMEASIAADKGTTFPASDWRSHLLDAEKAGSKTTTKSDLATEGTPPELKQLPPGMEKASAYARALNAKKPPMPDELRAATRREAIAAVREEMAWVEKNGTPAEKAAYAAKAAEYFDAFGDKQGVKEANAMGARANVALASKEKSAETKGALLATAALQMSRAESFSKTEIDKTHLDAANAYTLAAAGEKGAYHKAELLGLAGDEYRAAGKEKEAVAAYREGAKSYLAAAKTSPSIVTSKTATSVTTADLGGSPTTGEWRARTLGHAAELYDKAGGTADKDAAKVLRDRSTALHELALKEAFKDPAFVPPVALDGGKITPKSIHDYEKAIVKKNGGDFAKAAAEFDALKAKLSPGSPQEAYFEQAANRMRQQQLMKDAGVKDLEHPPTRQNLADYAKARADFWRTQKDADGLPLSERDVAQKTASELGAVADAYYEHHDHIGPNVDYQPGAKNVTTTGLSGAMHCDCEVYAYDVALAMEAAGFKATTESRDPLVGGPSHVVVNLQGKDGTACGTLSNGSYYGSADEAFKDVGLPPGATKPAVIRDRKDDPKAPKI